MGEFWHSRKWNPRKILNWSLIYHRLRAFSSVQRETGTNLCPVSFAACESCGSITVQVAFRFISKVKDSNTWLVPSRRMGIGVISLLSPYSLICQKDRQSPERKANRLTVYLHLICIFLSKWHHVHLALKLPFEHCYHMQFLEKYDNEKFKNRFCFIPKLKYMSSLASQ